MRVGIGYDSHAYMEGDHIMIGGVKIPFEYGVKAHSDGDVLLHALCDALLGAAALQDIGCHFADTNAEYANRASTEFLKVIMAKIQEARFSVVNMDSTVICQRPKLQPYIATMQAHIAQVLQCEPSRVSIKAKTNEGMGFVGRKEGLVAQVVVLLQEDS